MCGIAGFFRPAGLDTATVQADLGGISAKLSHRGPDDSGIWLDAPAGIAMSHRRLSILDLSAAGHQPMISASGRYVIVFNGEVYNHSEVRAELDRLESPPHWRGHADTEILLAAFERWGIEAGLKKTVGMFALALWDRQERILTLARDRVGEKPLYYGWQGEILLFASELKALRAHSAFRSGIDRTVLAAYFRRGYITAPQSIYENIFKLVPGAYVQFSGHKESGHMPRPRTYWSLREVAARGLADPFDGGETEAVNQLNSVLSRAVADQCIADVPLGAFLSGGIDSSTIVALMQAQSRDPVKTFTIGFHEDSYNEADHAGSVARQLGTDHTDLIVTAKEAMEVIPRLASIYDEPFGDSSAIPTFLVSQLARRQVTVALSGDGGDELFCGYSRYQRTHDLWSLLGRVPHLARKTMSLGVGALWGRGSSISGSGRAARLVRYLRAESAAALYEAQMTQSHNADELVMINADLGVNARTDPDFPGHDIYSTMMYMDTMTYLPDDILVKVDRASMAVGLEVRVPILDHRVLEFAWTLAASLKVRQRTGKWLLKEVLKRYLPDPLIARPKMGFGVPVGDWVRGPLREWAESLLCEDRLRREGFLNPRLAREQWKRHLAGDSVNGDTLWHLLAFQAWLANTA
jgi:asparagine synthase (glutamine-hydrolysing)